MNNNLLRFRQVHLDFHTSPMIPDIGINFDAKKFAQTLKDAHVDSVTCFARCHHGMLYFDSKQFPERIHPNLHNKNMLKEMIEACHALDIRVPIYTTIQWDKYTSQEHPEWIAMDDQGKIIGTKPYEAGFYETLCVNTAYRDFLKMHIKELFEMLDVDGIFMDIVYPTDCSCQVCRTKMVEQGIDIYHAESRKEYAQKMIDAFKFEISTYIRSFKQDASIFYNTSHIGVNQRAVKDAYSHFELESLPSGDWGYIHFPITMRYARNLGLECLSHTGKFHTEWGDFHSFKNLAALEYECFRMLALGSKCLIGDQMEPRGALSQHVYDLIGSVYARVEALEPWCINAKPVVEIGVLTPEEYYGGNRAHLSESLMGVENMFDQLGYQFDIIDSADIFEKYALIVLPDYIPMPDALHQKLQMYMKQGGKLIATYESGLSNDQEYALTEAGIKVVDVQTYRLDGTLARGKLSPTNDYIDYLLPEGSIGENLPDTEHVMYIKGLEIQALQSAEILAHFITPYFDRTFEHFCSHKQTPSSGEKGNPAIVKKDGLIYFASPIFQIYNARAPRWCKTLFKNAAAMLLPEQLVLHNGPSSVMVSLMEQEEELRFVLHVLHYIPQKICNEIHTIEDVIALHALTVKVLTGKTVKNIVMVPEMEVLPFTQEEHYVKFTIPKLEGYQVVEITYK